MLVMILSYPARRPITTQSVVFTQTDFLVQVLFYFLHFEYGSNEVMEYCKYKQFHNFNALEYGHFFNP